MPQQLPTGAWNFSADDAQSLQCKLGLVPWPFPWDITPYSSFFFFVTVTCKDDELRKSRLFSSVALFKATRESYGPKSIFCYSTETPEVQSAVGGKKNLHFGLLI